MARVLASLLLLAATGCAGGWRNGTPPVGYESTTSAAVSAAAPVATPAPAAKPAVASSGKSTSVTADGVLFRYEGAATSVNVAGEFNAWSTSADALARRTDGVWELKKALAAGRYQYKFVVNGSDWKADAAAPETQDDGFGGKNSVVVVGAVGAVGAAAAAAPAAPAAAATKPTGSAPAAAANGVVFRYSGAGSSVNLAGEFNSWSTSGDPLTKAADGTWTITKKLDAGRYAYKFVIDGGTWKEDPNAAEFVDDGFGGKNSVVVVGAGAAATPAPTTPAAPAPGAGGGAAGTGSGVVFRYSGAANSVHLAGEFNSWSTSADALNKGTDGTWTITKPLAPGRYAYKFVIDGGTWKEDPNATEFVDDGYGGKNSVMVVADGPAGATAATPAPAAAAPVKVTGKAKAPVVGANGVTFTFAGAATSVALAGDFNDWSLVADPLVRQADGTWTITKKLPAGSHGYKFVVDGTTWKSDEANPASADDGFGGKNSVVVVK